MTSNGSCCMLDHFRHNEHIATMQLAYRDQQTPTTKPRLAISGYTPFHQHTLRNTIHQSNQDAPSGKMSTILTKGTTSTSTHTSAMQRIVSYKHFVAIALSALFYLIVYLIKDTAPMQALPDMWPLGSPCDRETFVYPFVMQVFPSKLS